MTPTEPRRVRHTMAFAIADPPYVGQARKHYGHLGGAEVDQGALIDRLMRDYPDGWALCCSSPSLQGLLPRCPPTVRILAWVKPFCSFKPGVNPAYAWEPVIVWGGRPRTRRQPTVRDWVSASITLRRGLAGVKPDTFWYWLFEILGAHPGDTLDDLYPGSGGAGRAWKRWLSLSLRLEHSDPTDEGEDDGATRPRRQTPTPGCAGAPATPARGDDLSALASAARPCPGRASGPHPDGGGGRP